MTDAQSDVCRWPRITIITPSFNQGRFIEETLNSVLSQNYPNLEYFVMDGGSTDETVEIIRKYDSQISGWRSNPDGGQSVALREGFASATGEIWGWLCADDVLLPGSLSTVAKLCPPSGWVIGSSWVMNEQGELETLVSHPNYRRFDVLHNSYILNQPSVFWSSKLYAQTKGVDRSLHYAMDWDLWRQFEEVCAPVVVPAILSAFRVHGRQKTANKAAFWNELWSARCSALKDSPSWRHIRSRSFWKLRKWGSALHLTAGVGEQFFHPRF